MFSKCQAKHTEVRIGTGLYVPKQYAKEHSEENHFGEYHNL